MMFIFAQFHTKHHAFFNYNVYRLDKQARVESSYTVQGWWVTVQG